MKTIVLEKPEVFKLTDTEYPTEPGPGQALVRIRRVGICGTDLHAFKGKQPFFSYPRILGHELGCEVLAVDPTNNGAAVGDTCAVQPYMNCGQCSPCRRGKPNCCENIRVLGIHTDGGMREQIIVPADKLYPSTRLSISWPWLSRWALAPTPCAGRRSHPMKMCWSSEPGRLVWQRSSRPKWWAQRY